MDATLKKKFLILLIVAYFIALQATVVCLVAQWYSSGGKAAVAWQSGPIREYAGLSWSPRTHLPINYEQDLPEATAPTPAFYSADEVHHGLPGDDTILPSSFFDLSPLGDRAPPSV
jgi:hypothetical protein